MPFGLTAPRASTWAARLRTLGGLLERTREPGCSPAPPWSRLQPDLVVDRLPQPLLTPEVAFRRFHRNVPEKELDLLQFAACRMAQARARPPTVVGCKLLNALALCAVLHNVPDALFGDAVSPNRTLATHAAKHPPSPTPAALVHSWSAAFTQSGTGTVRICLPLPIKSTSAQCSSRCWTSRTWSFATSARRRPQPRRMARMARSRRPFNVCPSGACNRLRH